jgi:hypothetical protein
MLRPVGMIGPGKSRYGYAYWEESVELVDDGSWLYFDESGGTISLSGANAESGFAVPDTTTTGAFTVLADNSFVFMEA